jgi:hypothetical protein
MSHFCFGLHGLEMTDQTAGLFLPLRTYTYTPAREKVRLPEIAR